MRGRGAHPCASLRRKAAPRSQRNAFATNIAGVFFTFLAPCHHSNWTLGAYAAENCTKRSLAAIGGYLPQIDWLPHYWAEENRIDLLAKGFSSVPDGGGLDLMAPDRLEELITKHGSVAPSPLLDLYRAYHQVAARTRRVAYPDVSIRLADDTERRLYLIGRDGQPAKYDTFLEGWADLRPELVDGRLRLHLRLDQLAFHAAHNMYDQFSTYPLDGGERYVVDNGLALIRAVKLWHGTEPVEVASLGADGQGGFSYEAKATSLDGLVAEVDLDLFGDRRQLVYDLANGDYAIRLRRAGPRAKPQ